MATTPSDIATAKAEWERRVAEEIHSSEMEGVSADADECARRRRGDPLVHWSHAPADCPVKAAGDLDELQAIHRDLLQDIYVWAGKLRAVDLEEVTLEEAQLVFNAAMKQRQAAQ